MPLLDHSDPPLSSRHHWESFHVTWASRIADALNEELLPEGYFAEEHAHAGARIEIDVATFTEAASAAPTGVVATLTYAPPMPTLSVPAAFPDEFEVRIYEAEGGARLVAALELISPGNKDRDAHRRAFATKCAGYLAQGIALIVVDVVTNRLANLHAEIMHLLGQSREASTQAASSLYAVAYRPLIRDSEATIEIWVEALAVGRELPTLPLTLNAELVLPIDLEASYSTACQRRRLSQE